MSSFSLGQSRLFSSEVALHKFPFLGFVVPPLLLFFFLPAASTFSDRPTFFQPGGVGAKRKQKASAAFQKQSRAEMQPSLFKYNRLKRSAAI
jgi:hypothetical protein